MTGEREMRSDARLRTAQRSCLPRVPSLLCLVPCCSLPRSRAGAQPALRLQSFLSSPCLLISRSGKWCVVCLMLSVHLCLSVIAC